MLGEGYFVGAADGTSDGAEVCSVSSSSSSLVVLMPSVGGAVGGWEWVAKSRWKFSRNFSRDWCLSKSVSGSLDGARVGTGDGAIVGAGVGVCEGMGVGAVEGVVEGAGVGAADATMMEKSRSMCSCNAVGREEECGRSCLKCASSASFGNENTGADVMDGLVSADV